ncbi:glycosyltransferase, partial [Patescibacteria group bacterium]|nr:glycosyltransferase [Patescibacteria group bacterium]
IDIVVPVKNEEKNVAEITRQIHHAMEAENVSYRVIFVVDKSTDSTLPLVKKLSKSYPIKVHEKKGLPGKGFSLLEGFEVSTAEYVGFIDGDIQYPPQALPHMLAVLRQSGVGVVVANRKDYKSPSLIRKIGSRANVFVFGRLLLGFKTDIQSGLKVFRRDIYKHIDLSLITAWTFDIPLLHAATELGYKIENYDISFESRNGGASHVGFLKTGLAIATCAIKTRFKDRRIYRLGDHNEPIIYRNKKYVTHSKLSQTRSAIYTLITGQKITLVAMFVLLIFGLFANALLTFQILIGLLSAIYFLDVVFNLYVVLKSLHFPPEYVVSLDEVSALNESKLPVYTVLCPLYKEANVLGHFVDNVNAIDWPKNKLEVLLLLEENDKETVEAAEAMHLPDHFKIVVVPHSMPKTKPKACNYGLNIATGEYVVIYDAEDNPDKQQLKKAYIAFQRETKKTVCIQAKLNYYNPHHNLLTRFFTAEYSLWFDVVLPGLQSIDTTIPLGGTSNHFRTNKLRELHGWDPFNVTEDCDLGARLFKEGYKTAIIDSVTFEEANSNVKNWIRQRSRWIKGYMQTFFVHMRDPINFFKTHKFHALIFQLVIGLRIYFMLINPILWLTTIAYFVFYAHVGAAIEAVYPTTVFYMAAFSLVFGNFVYMYNYMIGCAKRGHWSLIKFALLIPFYWLLISVAAVMAFYQLIFKPHHWEKTVHGLHLKKKAEKEAKLAKANAKVETSSLRILLFNWRDTKHVWAGGAEVYVQEVAKRLVENGHQVTFFCGNDRHSPATEVIDGVRIVRKGGLFTVYIWAFFYYMFKFRGKYDVILTSENAVPFLTALYAKEPVVVLIHHVHQSVYKKNLPKPLATIACFLESKVMPFAYRKSRLVTVSESSKNDMFNLGFGKKNKQEINIINPGVTTAPIKPYKKTKTPQVVYLGRLKYYKSLDVLLNAMVRVLETEPTAQLVVAGYGESRGDLEKLADNLGIAKNITFAGRVTEEEKNKLLSESWVFVNPSQMEGWGISVIEANACGTPVVASNVPGLRDSVRNPHSGFLVDYGNAEKFAEKISLILSDKKLRTTLQSQCIEWAANYSWDSSANKILDILKDHKKNG